MRCSSCGAFLKKDQKFCPECENSTSIDFKKEVIKKSQILIHIVRSHHSGPSRKLKKGEVYE